MITFFREEPRIADGVRRSPAKADWELRIADFQLRIVRRPCRRATLASYFQTQHNKPISQVPLQCPCPYVA